MGFRDLAQCARAIGSANPLGSGRHEGGGAYWRNWRWFYVFGIRTTKCGTTSRIARIFAYALWIFDLSDIFVLYRQIGASLLKVSISSHIIASYVCTTRQRGPWYCRVGGKGERAEVSDSSIYERTCGGSPPPAHTYICVETFMKVSHKPSKEAPGRDT